MQVNYSVNFQKHWASNQRLLSADYVILNQRAMQSEQSVFCCSVYQRYKSIQKSMNVLKELFTIGLYNIIRLCSTQQLMIVSNYIQMVRRNHGYFQSCHCKYWSDNHIIECSLHHKNRGQRSKYTQKIISSSVIQRYAT